MKFFEGSIANKKLKDFKQYDNSLKTYNERASFVHNVLYEDDVLHDFFSIYFNNYYDVSPSQGGCLAEDDSVCKLLDILGTYMLGANDIQSHRKVQYRFWKNEREYRDYQDSQNTSLTVESNEDGKDIEIFEMFVNNKEDKNQTIVKGTSIYKKDIKDIAEIRALEDAIDELQKPRTATDIKERVKSILESGKCNEKDAGVLEYVYKNTDRFLASYIKRLRESQVHIKETIKKPITFKKIQKSANPYDAISKEGFSDANVNKVLLKMIGREDTMMTEIGLMIFDFKQIMSRTLFTDNEYKIIELFKQGYQQDEIPKELGIDRRTVSDYVRRIAKKVAKQYTSEVSQNN